MTLGEAIARVQNLGYSSDLATSQREGVLDALRLVYYNRRWPWRMTSANLTLAAGARTIAPPPDYKDADALRVSDGATTWEVQWQSPQVLRAHTSWDPGAGLPTWWTFYADVIEVWPAADRVYTAKLDYAKKFPTFAVDGADDDIELPGPEDWHQYAVWKAAVRSAHRERQRAQAQEYNAEAAQLWSGLIAASGAQQRQSGRQVARSGFYEDDHLEY